MSTTPEGEPPRIVTAPPQIEHGDATGGIIPYKNPHALTAYYLGIFSIIPVVGFFLGATALILGISGLRQRKKRPMIGGAVHAGIGIIGGGLSVLAHLVIIAFIVFRAMNR
ncbi:MAG: hypothetical protein JWM68_3923 [Verrucomicrobiales bacterium]|nr:hypothetical protein [Verrucomicrobiales bacterium]